MPHDFLDFMRIPRPGRRRRKQPRIPAFGSFCTEIGGDHERYAIVSDVSATGLRLHRPYDGRRCGTVQLEFDLPGVDDMIWAKGVVCFDWIWRAPEGRILHT